MEAKAEAPLPPRKLLCPSKWGTRGPAVSPASETGRERRTQGARPRERGQPGPPPPEPRTPDTRADHYLPRLERFGRHNQACGSAHGSGSPMQRPRGGDPRCKPLPSRGSPNVWGGAQRRPRPSYPSRLLAEEAFAEARPIRARSPENDQCATRSCKKSPPLVTSKRMGGRIFFGLPSSLPPSLSALAAHVRWFRASGVVRGRDVWRGAAEWVPWGAFSLRVGRA